MPRQYFFFFFFENRHVSIYNLIFGNRHVDWNRIDKMVWKPAKNGSFKVKILLLSPND